jgi:outer membrane lipoprotein-sorting protein
MQSFQAAAAELVSIQADFVQEKHLPILKQPLISTGRFCFRRPNLFRWEYQNPIQSVMLMNPSGITRYVFSQGHFVKDDGVRLEGVQVILQQMIGWLRGQFDNQSDFAIHCPQPDQIVLLPQQPAMAKMISRIELNLSSRAGVIDSVFIYEDQTAYTAIHFKQVNIDADVPDAEFVKP